MKLTLVLGTRPQIVKSLPLVEQVLKHPEVDFKVIHTGQHYDYEMSKVFFEEAGIPDPSTNLGVGSGSHAYQTAEIMVRLEKILAESNPDLVIVPGDTNSALASAVVSAKLQIGVAHVEAGARSYDMSMPEEVNRRLVDHISSLLFAPSGNCAENLKRENVLGRVHLTGDTMYDALVKHMSLAVKSDILEKIKVEPRSYAVLTVHRAENVDYPQRLRNIVEAITSLGSVPLIFPVHVRTKNRLNSFGLLDRLEQAKHIKLLGPLGYYDMLKLMSEAKLVLTDSGGVQKEAFWLGVPCVTLRERTEWTETVELGANFLAGCDVDRILCTTRSMILDENIRERIKRMPNPYGDGRASERIVEFVLDYMEARARQ